MVFAILEQKFEFSRQNGDFFLLAVYLHFSRKLEFFMCFLGPDGGKFDFVIVYTDVGSTAIKCYFSKFLDSGDFEEGSGCYQLS